MTKKDLIFNLILVPLDLAMLLAAAFAAYFLRFSPPITDLKPVLFNLPIHQYLTLSIIVASVMIIIFALSGLYLMRRTTPVLKELTRVALDVSAGITLVVMYMFFNRDLFDSRFILLAAWIFAIVFVSFSRVFIRALRRLLFYTRKIGGERILIVGKGEEVKHIKEQINKNKKIGLQLVGALSEPSLDRVRSLHKKHSLERVIVIDAKTGRDEIMKIVNYCEEHGIQFSYVPDMFGAIVADMSFDVLEGLPIVSVKPSPLDGWGRVLKRLVDIVGALTALLLLWPLFLVFSIMIKWETEGPVFVKLKRVSHSRRFYLYKFRSMVKDADKLKKELLHLNERSDGPLFKLAEDPRITRTGRFLRAHRFDELPQLFNVLKGDISLVGPRPHEPAEIKQYSDHHKKVLAIKSGITGLAQISGASDLSFEEEVKLDRFYIENWSIKKDILILFKTLKMLVFDRSGV